MTITKEEKLDIISKFGKNEKDVGNIQVQVAILTKRILRINEHFKKNKKDNHCLLGLMKLISKRKRFLTYIKRKDLLKYKELIVALNIRK